ncbi:hypothetical protein Patl1_20305 [Pistacia atlantica]|uniref:Uncharacterized protein n=1 Tax=Pistacia atlantica TaxID=434234 RepID=A0ACC1BJK7_9ROSI|nr:hypothetical protein Patl1_20305 [Pistacia atlantica]
MQTQKMESISYEVAGGVKGHQGSYNSGFQMPQHYPKYCKSDYEAMPEWQLNRLLSEYGLPVIGSVEQKRKFAMGAFLWPQ